MASINDTRSPIAIVPSSPAAPIEKPKLIGVTLPGKTGHITLTFAGRRTLQEVESLEADVHALRLMIGLVTHEKKTERHGIEFEFGEWTILGKPDEIAAGRGLEARKCRVVDPLVDQLLVALHRKWYYHEAGEAEERKVRQHFHVSVNPAKGVTRDTVDTLTRVTCPTSSIFVK